MTQCVARAGEQLRVSSRSLPVTRREILPSGMHKPWAGSNRYKISELIAVHRRMATPGRFTLTTFLCTLQDTISDDVLIRTLQHSILGTWLTPTQARFSLASHQTISSPHVHLIVIRFTFRERLRTTPRLLRNCVGRLPIHRAARLGQFWLLATQAIHLNDYQGKNR